MDINKLKGMKGVFDSAGKTKDLLDSLEPPDQPNFESILNHKPEVNIPDLQSIDNRSRTEKKEDREFELALIDFDDINEALEFMEDPSVVESMDDDALIEKKKLVVDCLEKFSRYKAEFEELNSDHYRRIKLKQHELFIEANADWKEKWRTFWFRVLGSLLLIITLFAIGTIHHHVNWLYLPFESVMKMKAITPTTASQVMFQPSVQPDNTDQTSSDSNKEE